jgi:adenosylhomocysteine nucleosidase
MKILVTFALENEFAPWRDMRQFRAERWGATEAYFTEIGEAQLGVVLTGVAARQAWVEATKVFWSEFESVACCISSGLSGALKPAYQVGQVLVARTLRTAERHADLKSDTLRSDESLVNVASANGATVVEAFYTSSRLIASAVEKQKLETRADAVEMESFEIVKEAQAFGIPAVAVRAISDSASESLPLDFGRVMDDFGRVSTPRVLGEVLRKPRAIPGLIRLGQQSKRASESLADFLDRYVAAVAAKQQFAGASMSAATR